MNNKYIERPKQFDKRAYNDDYQKKHYVSFAARIKPDLQERINNYCKDNNIKSKSEFLKMAIDILENNHQ